MKKLSLDTVRTYLRRRAELVRQVKALSKENEQLREKIAGLQQAKAVAVNQAEELRDEKERLRERIRSFKQDMRKLEAVNANLDAKVLALHDAVDQLEARVRNERTS